MANKVRVSGMFGNDKTYFADSPVVIDISDLQWSREGQSVTSPFTIVRIEVIYNGRVVGNFHCDTGGQTTASFDISSALRSIWSGFNYGKEIEAAENALVSLTNNSYKPESGDGYDSNGVRTYREYSLRISTEYLDSQDGEFTTTVCYVVIDGVEYTEIPGGRCAMGNFTEWERSIIPTKEAADVSYREHENLRNGDASTKPHPTTENPNVSPERVGIDSITSWVDVQNDGTHCVYYSAGNDNGTSDSRSEHAPIVLRDSQPYVDFLFTNRRGAVETCSGMTKEQMGINTDVKQYSRSERPSFRPTRSLMAIGTDGRRSWQMSSGYVTREWAEWWTMEFLGGKRKQWWMRMKYQGKNASGIVTTMEKFVPVTVKPAKNDTTIYDKTKQQMPHVDFTVTLALEG